MKNSIIFIILMAVTSSFATTKAPHLSRTWYPVDLHELENMLDRVHERASLRYDAAMDASKVHAIIAPHAGIAYSGAVAGAVYRKTDPSTKRVIILAPDHTGKLDGIAVPSFEQFVVPNGALAVDRVTAKLADHALVSVNDEVFQNEHSLEMQLPFIARAMPKASIVPIIVGSLDCGQSQKIAATLRTLLDEKTLVVVTSDFVHYGKRFSFTPFADHQQLRIRRLNSKAVELIERGRCDDFAQFMAEDKPTICGSKPLMVLLSLLEQQAFVKSEPRFLAADSSSHRDDEDSVSYLGMAFTGEPLASLPIEKRLTQEEQRGLLQESQDVFQHLFDEQPEKSLFYPIRSSGVRQSLGAFTTLSQGPRKKLRGCIGRIMTDKPLYETIKIITEDSALRDSRFRPVTRDEIPSIRIKVSVLSLPWRITDEKSITLGKHGIIWRLDGASAVFLPEVPGEQGWNLRETLQQLAEKAGLPREKYDDERRQLEIFSTVDIE